MQLHEGVITVRVSSLSASTTTNSHWGDWARQARVCDGRTRATWRRLWSPDSTAFSVSGCVCCGLDAEMQEEPPGPRTDKAPSAVRGSPRGRPGSHRPSFDASVRQGVSGYRTEDPTRVREPLADDDVVFRRWSTSSVIPRLPHLPGGWGDTVRPWARDL